MGASLHRNRNELYRLLGGRGVTPLSSHKIRRSELMSKPERLLTQSRSPSWASSANPIIQFWDYNHSATPRSSGFACFRITTPRHHSNFGLQPATCETDTKEHPLNAPQVRSNRALRWCNHSGTNKPSRPRSSAPKQLSSIESGYNVPLKIIQTNVIQ